MAEETAITSGMLAPDERRDSGNAAGEARANLRPHSNISEPPATGARPAATPQPTASVQQIRDAVQSRLTGIWPDGLKHSLLIFVFNVEFRWRTLNARFGSMLENFTVWRTSLAPMATDASDRRGFTSRYRASQQYPSDMLLPFNQYHARADELFDLLCTRYFPSADDPVLQQLCMEIISDFNNAVSTPHATSTCIIWVMLHCLLVFMNCR
jgi:hypothetical protein